MARTTLEVPGVRRIICEIFNIALDRKNEVTVWLEYDPEPTGKDTEEKWKLIVKGACGEIVRHVNMRRWDGLMDYQTTTNKDRRQVRQRQAAAVDGDTSG